MKPRSTDSLQASRSRQRGAAAIEFALVASLFIPALLGAMEMGRILFYWNTAAEATRLGARTAVVCNLNSAAIKTKMRGLLKLLGDADVSVNYSPAACSVDTCDSVTVSTSMTTAIQTYIPYVPMSLLLPSFTTTLTRESMQSTLGGVANPVCQ